MFFSKENPYTEAILHLILEAGSLHKGESNIQKEIEVLFRNLDAMGTFKAKTLQSTLLREA